MTNEGAISILLYMKHDVLANSSEDVAIDMAIEALKSKKPKTNGDKIRSMTDEQIAEMLDIYSLEEICDYCIHQGNPYCPDECHKGILEWLKQEVQEDAVD